MSLPTRTLSAIAEKYNGMSTAPELVTLAPMTSCAKTGMKKMAPYMAMATVMLETFERVKTEFFQSLNGSTGSPARFSLTTNAIRTTAPATYRETICHEPHRYWVPPQEVASSTAESPSPKATKPT